MCCFVLVVVCCVDRCLLYVVHYLFSLFVARCLLFVMCFVARYLSCC